MKHLLAVCLLLTHGAYAESIQVIYPKDAQEAVQEAAQAIEAVSSHTICLEHCEASRTYEISYMSLFDLDADVLARTEKGCTTCIMQFRRSGPLAIATHDMFVHTLVHEFFHALVDYDRPGYHNLDDPNSVMKPDDFRYEVEYRLTEADIKSLNSW